MYVVFGTSACTIVYGEPTVVHGQEIGWCPGSWRVPLPSPILRLATDWPHISPLPPPSVLEEEEGR